MKPIKFFDLDEKGTKKRKGDRGHNLPLLPFLQHTQRQKQIYPSGGCSHRDFLDRQTHTSLPAAQRFATFVFFYFLNCVLSCSLTQFEVTLFSKKYFKNKYMT